MMIPQRASALQAYEDAHWLALLQPIARSGVPGWLEAHDRLVEETTRAKETGGADILVYGDSIMEAFRGECLGQDFSDTFAANKAAWDRGFGGQRALVLALCGDQAVHLLWRLGRGEGPQGLNAKHIALMIGTNDAGHLSNVYQGAPDIAGRIISLAVQQNVRELQRQAPQASIVVLGLLPLQPPSYTPAGVGAVRTYDAVIAEANREIAGFVQKQGLPNLKFQDCGPAFLLPSGAVNYTRMPDGVHPEGDGGELLLECMRRAMGV